MADQLEYMYKPNVPEAADEWARQLVENIRRNFRTQGIFPYTDRNLWYGSDDKPMQWRSTGAAFDNLFATVVAASETYIQVDLFYQRYLDYVDLGVGWHRKAEQVQRDAEYSHKWRYEESWDAKAGKTQRPVVQVELYNTRKRMLNYMRRFYLYNAPIYIMRAAGFEMGPYQGAQIMNPGLTIV